MTETASSSLYMLSGSTEDRAQGAMGQTNRLEIKAATADEFLQLPFEGCLKRYQLAVQKLKRKGDTRSLRTIYGPAYDTANNTRAQTGHNFERNAASLCISFFTSSLPIRFFTVERPPGRNLEKGSVNAVIEVPLFNPRTFKDLRTLPDVTQYASLKQTSIVRTID
jgi:hypothetical protein